MGKNIAHTNFQTYHFYLTETADFIVKYAFAQISHEYITQKLKFCFMIPMLPYAQ